MRRGPDRHLALALGLFAALASACEQGTECTSTVRHEGRTVTAPFYMSDDTREANPAVPLEDLATIAACRTLCDDAVPQAPYPSEASSRRHGALVECQSACRRDGSVQVSCERTTRHRTMNFVLH